MKNNEARQLGGRRNQQIGHGRGPVMSTVGEQLLDLDRTILDGGVRYSQGIDANGGRRRPARRSSPVRAL